MGVKHDTSTVSEAAGLSVWPALKPWAPDTLHQNKTKHKPLWAHRPPIKHTSSPLRDQYVIYLLCQCIKWPWCYQRPPIIVLQPECPSLKLRFWAVFILVDPPLSILTATVAGSVINHHKTTAAAAMDASIWGGDDSLQCFECGLQYPFQILVYESLQPSVRWIVSSFTLLSIEGHRLLLDLSVLLMQRAPPTNCYSPLHPGD